MKNKLLLVVSLCLFCIGFYSCTSENEVSLSEKEISTRSVGDADLRVFDFPHVDDILKSTVVQQKMEEAWKLMKSSYSGTTRREYSFYIYYNQETKTYWTDAPNAGDPVSGCEGTNTSVQIGRPSDNTQCCAFFHCHTPLTNCPSTVSRETIAFQGDLDWANKYEIPGILFDYDMNPLRGGHDINLQHKTIVFGDYKQRPSFGFNVKTGEYVDIK